MSLTRRVATYLGTLQSGAYKLPPGPANIVNYLLDSYFAKLDEIQKRSQLNRVYIPDDLENHIKELWLGCDIHHCLSVSHTYPAYKKSLNAWALSRLFVNFSNPGAAYEIMPFLDEYAYKESLKNYSAFRTKSEQINISLTQNVTLPVFGTFFIVNKVTGTKFVINFDLCHYNNGCSITIMTSPDQQLEAERFFADLHASMKSNDIYFKQCLSFDRGVLDFFGIIPTQWGEVVLKDDIKNEIRENSVGILSNMAVLASVGMVPNRNIILISPPGMAKTTMFRATSNEVEGTATRIWCTGKSITYPEHVTALFEAARSLAPCIIFIEDMDLFGGERNSIGRDPSLLNEFLAQLDGAQANSGVIVMASTNDVCSMDEALIARPGRFGVKVDIPLPDEVDRRQMLQNFLSDLNVKPDKSVTADTIKTVIDLCDGFTGDYVKELAKAAVIRATADGRSSSGFVLMCSDDLITAANQVLKNYRIGLKAKKHHFMIEEGANQPSLDS
jgi:AAA+ superfamily predicted ATPase